MTETLSYAIPRRRLLSMWITAIVYVLVSVGFVVIVAMGTWGSPLILLAFLVAVVLVGFGATLIAIAYAHTGVVIALDGQELRQRDVAGWVHVPWNSVTSLTTDSRGRVLTVTSPSMRLNDKPLKRGTLQVALARFDAQADEVLAAIRDHRERYGIPTS